MNRDADSLHADDKTADLMDYLKASLQYPLPQHLISRLTHRLTRIRHPGFKDWMITDFIRRFGVDMREAAQEDLKAYATFNAFFTRALKTGARPVDMTGDALVSPVDGTVSQLGAIEGERIFQAKGRDYTALELLGRDAVAADRFAGGAFATLYLSPRDYHRIHMPV